MFIGGLNWETTEGMLFHTRSRTRVQVLTFNRVTEGLFLTVRRS
jgi:hypothetical protein